MDTVQLKAIIYDQEQQPVSDARVIVVLDRFDQDINDKQYIMPRQQSLTTDANGEVLFYAWKNSEGVRSSSYVLQAFKSGYGELLSVTFTVPDNAADGTNIMDIATIAPFPSKSEYVVALEVVQAEVLKAEAARDAAELSADAAATSASAAAASEVAAAASAAAAEESADRVDLGALDTAVQDAQDSASAAAASEAIAADSAATSEGFAIQAENHADRAEVAADVAMTAGWIYIDVAAGEAARTDGEYFWVVSADDNEVLELWLMGTTTATDTGKRAPSQSALENAQDNSERARFHIYGRITAFNHNNDFSVTLSSSRLILYKGDTTDIATITELTIPNGQCAYVDLDAPLDGSGKLQVFVGNARVGVEDNDWIDGSKIILLNVLGSEVGGLLDQTIGQFIATKSSTVVSGYVTKFDANDAESKATVSFSDLMFQRGVQLKTAVSVDDIEIPYGGCAYVDLSQASVVVQVSSDRFSTSVNNSRYPFSKDNLLTLLSVDAGGVVGGVLASRLPDTQLDSDSLIVEQTNNSLKIYKKGSKSDSNRWLRFDLEYSEDLTNVDLDKRYSCWRIRQAWLVERDNQSGVFTVVTDLTTPGEWECAIREDGAGDFMGGETHGNEFMQYATLLIDGEKVDPTASGNYVAKRVELTQKSELTQWGSSNSNVVANKFTKWDMNSGNFTLSHTIEWLASLNIILSYLAMLPIYRDRNAFQITDTGLRSPEWAEEDISVSGFSVSRTTADQARIWSNDTGVNADMRVVAGWDKPDRNFFFSNSPAYNKMYFDFTKVITTQVGDVWYAETVYKLDVNS